MPNRQYENTGTPPRRWPVDTRIQVTWANGQPARYTYTRDQLVWERRGWGHDIAWFARAE